MEAEIDPDVVNLQPLPPITQRLRDLRPSQVGEARNSEKRVCFVSRFRFHNTLSRRSQELLEFYRQKLAEFDGEHADMLARLDNLKASFEEKVGWSGRSGDEEGA
jgi:coiled-coil domain-containing protein 77